jgi:thiol-disulfide isomerase/thioredoxin
MLSRRSALALLGASTGTASLLAIDSREKAPKFHAKALTGEKYNNDSVKGSAVLLQFWATWCAICRGDQPAVEALAEDYASKGLIVLAVDVRESRSKVQRYLQESPRASKVVLMEDTNLAAVFAATAIPLYVLIDQNGKIAGTHKGGAGERGLRTLLRKAIEVD